MATKFFGSLMGLSALKTSLKRQVSGGPWTLGVDVRVGSSGFSLFLEIR